MAFFWRAPADVGRPLFPGALSGEPVVSGLVLRGRQGVSELPGGGGGGGRPVGRVAGVVAGEQPWSFPLFLPSEPFFFILSSF